MALEKKKTRNGDLWFLSDEIDVDEIDAKEKEKMEDYVARFEPERKFSFTVDNATIDTKLFECSPEVTFTSTKPIKPSEMILDHVSAPSIRDLMTELKELKTRVNRTVALVHNCQRCGASLEVDEHKSIFCCKYCGATYLLGSVQPNSVYN